MSSSRPMIIKFGIFAVIMAVLTVFLFFIFGQYRTGSTNGYSAVFNDVSRLKAGQTVRVAASGWAPSTASRSCPTKGCG
ncbi:mce family domain protein [Mycobacterium kansasii]|uniref:Mce family domain protein n=1 Tax=Mycobacterium kansasii TaxID=1768 RepID=A0A1V3WU32_MYCKA|nr:mce family domain protein [Mycobacterium kansasii]